MRQWSIAYGFEEEYVIRTSIRRVLVYAGACGFLWCLYLIAFYPGTMSPDSLDQWRQMLTFSFADTHPVFHTLCNWLITRVWLSPAAIALVQICFLATVVGFVLVQMEKAGVPRWACGGLAAIFALWPANGMYAVTLWKDVPYSASMLWLTGVLIAVVRTEGRWLYERRNRTHLTVALLFVLMFRHNGVVPVVATLAAMAVMFREEWKRIVRVALMCLMAVFLLKGPVYSALHVVPAAPWQGMSMPIHQVAAMVHEGAALDAEERALLERIFPLDLWSKGYNRYTADTVVHHQKFDKAVFDANSGAFARLWLHLAWQHPGVAIKDWARMTSLLWQVKEPEDGYTFSTQKDIDPNVFGLESAHRMGFLEQGLMNVVQITESREWNWLFWRPALWMYLLIGAAAVLILRFGKGHLLLAVPVLANAAGLLLTMPAQDSRYVYATLLIVPVLGVMTLAKK